jgi:peptidoglycan/LPS O-acetylase OafA/YrhL
MGLQTASVAPDPASGSVSAPRSRDLYIDRLRTIMTVIVILHHTAIRSTPSVLFTVFYDINQAYFMGFFFLVAGYFAPASLERKGYRRFIGDRLLRLGIPLLFYIVVLAPLSSRMDSATQGASFRDNLAWLWNRGMIAGPLWFVQALLLFMLAYCAWRAIAGAPLAQSQRTPTPVPAQRWWLLSALAVGAAAFAIRLVVPVGDRVIGLQLGYFATYIFLFAVGVAAWRHEWLTQFQFQHARGMILGLVLTLPVMPAATVFTHLKKIPANFDGGLGWPAIVYAFWEPLVAWGIISAWILAVRAAANRPSALWDWLNRRAYAVYIIHWPMLVGLELLLQGWAAPAILKFVLVGALTCAFSWLAADPLVRMPGVRRIV